MIISWSTIAKSLGFTSGLLLWCALPREAQACNMTMESPSFGVLVPTGTPVTGFTSNFAQGGTSKNVILNCSTLAQVSVSNVTQQSGPSVLLLPTSSASVALGGQTATSSGGSVSVNLGRNTVVTNITVNATAPLPSGIYQFTTVLTVTP